MGDATHYLSDHVINQHLIRMIEACFVKINACIQLIHGYTMMQIHNTIDQVEGTSVNHRKSLVHILLRWRFIPEVEGESVAIFTQTISLKPITGII